MPDAPSPEVRRRLLSNKLRELREAAGMGAAEAAEAMGWDRTKLHRIESSRWKRLKPDDVRGLAELYKVNRSEQVEALVELSEQARAKAWWSRYADILGGGRYVGLEAEALTIRTYEALVIPGLLQTEEYTQALLSKVPNSPSPEEAERRLKARSARRVRLFHFEAPLRLYAIIDEAALRKAVGGREVMRRQVRSLLNDGEQANISIRVLPDSAGAHAGLGGPFTLLELPGAPKGRLVFLESAYDGRFLEQETAVQEYDLIYDALSSEALSEEESAALMRSLAEEESGAGQP
ncbi:DUF5753 domain-containing protein [Nocardiopsis potens]|uniref:DUF5753 domain-containing protein n=1 Tax=Nocardiopsis potens TaxID=1246458 RepID=UPI000344AF36|nr:DUF5753 domain-containing protein [Nocardiopsis potens]